MFHLLFLISGVYAVSDGGDPHDDHKVKVFGHFIRGQNEE
jgi:hypothetical protein